VKVYQQGWVQGTSHKALQRGREVGNGACRLFAFVSHGRAPQPLTSVIVKGGRGSGQGQGNQETTGVCMQCVPITL
jgi:hypothetical protein